MCCCDAVLCCCCLCSMLCVPIIRRKTVSYQQGRSSSPPAVSECGTLLNKLPNSNPNTVYVYAVDLYLFSILAMAFFLVFSALHMCFSTLRSRSTFFSNILVTAFLRYPLCLSRINKPDILIFIGQNYCLSNAQRGERSRQTLPLH